MDPFGDLRGGVSLAKIEGGHDGTLEKEFPRSQEVPIAVVGCEFATMAPLGCRHLTLLKFECGSRDPRISGCVVVAMVQTAQTRVGDHSVGCCRSGSATRRFLAEPKVRSVLMVIRDIPGEKPS